jgi:hypothetical protein
VAFVPLREHVVNGTAAEKAEMAKVTNEPVSSIGAVMVYSEGTRTRFELCELRHRPVAIVDGFKDLAAGDDFSAPLDWVPAPHVRTTAVSPRGTSILTLTPLPDVPPYTLAVALVARPTGLALTHVNLVPPAEGDTAGAGKPRWPVLVGEEYALDASVGATGAALLPSQGVRRGEMGLVAVLGDGRPRLVPSPRLGTGAAPHETLKHTAERAARSVELAVIQGVDWSDALRAAFASVPRAQACDLAAAILDQAFSLFVNHARSYAPHILRLQVAVWALADDHRRVFADEMLRLGEAAQVLHLCGAERDGEIRFDLDSVWHLVDVFEWAIGTLGQVFREAISERAHAEWAPGVNSSTAASTSTRVLYLVHPLLRRILSRVVALLAAFAKFASTLDVPVRPPDGALLLPRSASAAAVVTQRVGDAVAREGVDLKMWADVLSTLDAKVARPSDADACAALLKFEVGALASLVPGALHHVPTPSALFLAPGPQPRDGASCALLGDKATARCDRCAAHTVVPPARTGVLSPWAAWRRTFVANCMCGGTWVRTHADKRA